MIIITNKTFIVVAFFSPVFNNNSVVVKLLRAEYNRRAQLRPLFWDSTIQLPLEKVYTRLKIVSRRRGGNQGETKCWGDVIWAEDFRRDEIWTEAWAKKANPCNVFSVLKENKDVTTIVEGNPGIGKTTFCLKLAYEWANQCSSAASFPEFELVLLLKCRDIEGDLTEAITEQLFPKDMSKDAREELFRFMEDIKNQERVLIILDGLDELAEKSKHYVDDLLHRKRWACCYVLTTTRQEKGIEVRKQPEFVFNLFLQIEGFTEEDSFEYIRRHFKIAGPEHSSKGEKLIEEINDNELLRDLQKNPLNLLLLCIVYEDHEGKLPSSRTNLYQVIVVCLLRRYCARYNVRASKEDMDLEKQFKRDIRCLGKLAWNCLLNDRHSFFEEELDELERRNEKLVARRLGFVYKEESLKRLKPQHEYCFLHKSFQEYLAASYLAHKLRRKKFHVFEHLDFDAVVKKFPQVFVFVCGILREEASILFEQIGEKLKSDWDWLKCSRAAANFFIESWSESGNAEGMANTLCSFMPFPRVLYSPGHHNSEGDFHLLGVIYFCRRFSKVVPDEIYLKFSPYGSPDFTSIKESELASLPNLKSLDFSYCDIDVESALEVFQSLLDFASLTELALPAVPSMTDWKVFADALTESKTLEKLTLTLSGERGDGWARVLDAGLCANTALSSVGLKICGSMSETALHALENLFLNKSLSSVAVIVKGDMPNSLAVTLSRCLTGQTAVKSLELHVIGKLSFCCANLIERGIIKNNSLGNLLVSLHGELPDNWQAIVDNLKVRLAEKSTINFAIYPNTFSQVTASQVTHFRPHVIENKELVQQSVKLNVWGELAVDGAEALYNFLPCTSVCHLTLNIHGKLTADFLHCTARHVDKKKPLCPITINTWEQLTNEGKALFKALELDKNPAVTLNVCQVHVPSDGWGGNEVECIDHPASLIALLERAENTGKENLTVTIHVHNIDAQYNRVGWMESLNLCFRTNSSLNSLTLTINNFSKSVLWMLYGRCDISLKSLTLIVNDDRKCDGTRGLFVPGEGVDADKYNKSVRNSYEVSDDDLDPNTSLSSVTLIIGNPHTSFRDPFFVFVLLSNFKSFTTLDLTLNNCGDLLVVFLKAVMEMNSLKTLRLKINDSQFTSGCREYDFSKLVVKSPSLELIELTISCYGVEGSSPETLKWEKQ